MTVAPSRGTWRVLRPLPVSDAMARVLEADAADGEVRELGDPGAGVVERGEQGRVAQALPGGPVGLGEQEPGLLDGQVPDGGAVLLLGGDGEDVLPAGHPGRVLGLHPRGERADRGQPLVAGRDAVAPVFLQMAEERRDGAGVEVVEGEPGGRDRPLVAEPGDQEPERVAVGRDRGGRAAAQPGQVGGEEAAQRGREVSRHGRPSGERAARCRRTRAWTRAAICG